jgi:hypothetical protein
MWFVWAASSHPWPPLACASGSGTVRNFHIHLWFLGRRWNSYRRRVEKKNKESEIADRDLNARGGGVQNLERHGVGSRPSGWSRGNAGEEVHEANPAGGQSVGGWETHDLQVVNGLQGCAVVVVVKGLEPSTRTNGGGGAVSRKQQQSVGIVGNRQRLCTQLHKGRTVG